MTKKKIKSDLQNQIWKKQKSCDLILFQNTKNCLIFIVFVF